VLEEGKKFEFETLMWAGKKKTETKFQKLRHPRN
jgi:hypothetical protein